MKPLLPILLLLLSLPSFAQQPMEPLPQKSDAQKQLDYIMKGNYGRPDSVRLNTIQLNLYQFSKQYSKGTTCIGIGIVLTAIGATILLKGNSQDEPIATAAVIGGGTFATIGYVIHVDSHKFIRRASGVRK